MSIHWPIIKRCLSAPSRIAAVDDQLSWKAVEILVVAAHIAAEIDRQSQAKTVGVLLPTGAVFASAILASWMTGRVVVPLNYLLKKEELQYVVNDCETDIILTVKPMLDHLGYTPTGARIIDLQAINFKGVPEPRWPASADDDDIAVLLYTSGTSGYPKGVMLSHGNITANIQQCCSLVNFDHRDVLLGVLPQFHSFGFTVLTVLPFTIGCKAVYTARFVPAKIVRLIREHRPTAFVGIPSMFNALLSVKEAQPEDFTSLRLAVSGGEPLPDSVTDEFYERFGVRIAEGFGLTETAPVTNICMPDHYVRRSVGKPVPRVDQRIVDLDTGATLGPEREGEIRFRGPNIMQGYFKLPTETAAAFDSQGWFRTGDIGRIDSHNRLYITGRFKEMIIVGGENVFPREIEEVLNRHPSVNASGVIGIRDDVRGELPWAFVEMREGASFDETALRHWCREHLAGYKVPREIRVVEALPRNPTGKIMRRELKQFVR